MSCLGEESIFDSSEIISTEYHKCGWESCSVVRVLAYYLQSPECSIVDHICNPSAWRQKQDNQKFKVMFGYTEGLRPTWNM